MTVANCESSFLVQGGGSAVGVAPRPFSLGMTRTDLERRYAALKVRLEAGELSRVEYRILRRGAARAYAEGKPERRKARRAVQSAVEAGVLTKPGYCTWPGDCSATAGAIEAHHTSYGRPLDVAWLCPIHHNLADLALARGLSDRG